MFGQLEGLVDDPKLRTIVRRHRTDEERHARLFRGCLERLGPGEAAGPRRDADHPPDRGRIRPATERALRTADDALGAYALLFAIEERGVEQFPLIADAFRAVDPETAAVYEQVARDERGHLLLLPEAGPPLRRRRGDLAGGGRPSPGRWRRRPSSRSASRTSTYCAEQGWVDTRCPARHRRRPPTRPPSADRGRCRPGTRGRRSRRRPR